MNDALIMDAYLLILKSTVEVYVHGTLESSNNDVRILLKKTLSEIMLSQAKTYDEMTKYGWYQVDNVSLSKIISVLNKIHQAK